MVPSPSNSILTKCRRINNTAACLMWTQVDSDPPVCWVWKRMRCQIPVTKTMLICSDEDTTSGTAVPTRLLLGYVYTVRWNWARTPFVTNFHLNRPITIGSESSGISLIHTLYPKTFKIFRHSRFYNIQLLECIVVGLWGKD